MITLAWAGEISLKLHQHNRRMRVPARRSGPEKGGVELWKSRRRRFHTVRCAGRIFNTWTSCTTHPSITTLFALSAQKSTKTGSCGCTLTHRLGVMALSDIKGFLEEKDLKSLYCYLYHRLWLILGDLNENRSLDATAQAIKALMDEIEP